MKTNIKRQVLSLIIAFLMVFTYVPAAAYGAETENADTAATVEETVVAEETQEPETSDEEVVTVEEQELKIVAEEAPAYMAAATEHEISVLDGQVLITNSKGTGSIADGVVTITAPGVFPGSPTANNIELINKSGKTATLTFDYKAENYYIEEAGGFSENLDESTYSILLEPNDSAKMFIKGKRAKVDNTAVLTLSNFDLEYATEKSSVTFDYDESLGSVSVSGETVADGTVKEISYAEGTAIEAVPADGVEFLGWIDKSNSKILSKESTYTLKPVKNMTVEAVFSGNNSKTYYLVGDEYLIDDFNEAANKAIPLYDKTVVLMKDTVLSAGNYIVPAGVTFLIPFDDEHTLYTDPREKDAPNMSVWGTYVEPTPYRTLTLADGANLIINGAVSLSAHHYAANGGGPASGGPTGPVSFLKMENNSNVTVNNGGALYAYGYVTGTGKVTAKKGSLVYELFQVEDFRGGGASASMAVNNMDKGVMPISQYYVQNIEVPLTLEAGASEYVYTSFFMTQSSLGSAVPFIGNSGAMFHMLDGSVTKYYDGSTDRLIVEAEGTMNLSPIEVTVDTQPLDSRDFDLGINGNISVIVKSGDVSINQDIALLPGSEISIEEDATCTLGEDVKVFVYDADQWAGYCGVENKTFVPISYAPGRTYNRTEADLVDAAVKVNGKMDATKGFIYTTTDADKTGGHANIYSTGNGVIEMTAGTQPCTYQFTQTDEGVFHEILLNPASLKHADGTYMMTESGKFTYVDIAWQCDHEVASENVIEEPTCTETGIKVVTCEKGHEYKAIVPAKGHTEVIDEAVEGTCTVDAKTEGSHCGVCGKILKAQIVTPAPGHTEIVEKGKPATCTESGMTDAAYCFVCDEVLSVKTVIDPLGHDWAVEGTEPTCTTPGYGSSKCNRCNESLEDTIIPALGHSYDWTVVTEPGCEIAGIKAGKCNREDCGHETVDSITPTGHSVKKVDRVDATCTTAGHEEYWQCRICDGYFEQESCETEFSKVPVLKAEGHKLVKTESKEATCTADGYEEYWTCKTCDVLFADEECKHEIEKPVVIGASGHTTVKTEAKAATCTADGNEEYWTCKDCGMIFADEAATEELAGVPVITSPGHAAVKTEAKAAACTVDGNEEYWTCGVCDSIFSDAACNKELEEVPVITSPGHNMKATEETGATCTKNGNSKYWTCIACDKLFADAEGNTEIAEVPVIVASGHSGAKVEKVAATCTETGNETYWVCTACDLLFADEACKTEIAEIPVIAASGHSAKGVAAAAPTCTEVGNEAYWTCEDCDGIFADEACETELDKVPVLKADGHRLEKTEKKESTCITKGHEEYWTCKTCEKIFADEACETELKAVPEIALSGHKEEKVDETSADCEKSGNETYWACRTCDKLFADEACKTELKEIPVIPAYGHSAKAIGANAPTCTEAGNEAYWICEKCDVIFADEACETKLDKIPVLKAEGHSPEKTEKKASTCITKGHEEYWTCKTCEKIFADEACETELKAVPEIALSGHKTEKVEGNSADCEKSGNETYWVCGTCDKLFADEACKTELEKIPVIPAYGHSAKAIGANAPTCTEAGNEAYWICEKCDGIFADEACETELDKIPVLKAKDHAPVQDPGDAATCTETGFTAGVYCPDCKTWIEGHEEISAIEHKNAVDKAGDSATCTADGVTDGKYCPDCDTWIEGHTKIDATGHQNTASDPGQAATCTADGVTAGTYCTDCDTWIEGHTVTPATNHADAMKYEGDDPTCTADGYTEGKYCPDCKTWIEGHTVISALNHKNAVDKAGTPATCTETGITAGKYCPDCKTWIEGHTVIPATNHPNATKDAGKAATCTADGITAGKYCPDCKTWFEGHAVIEAQGHKYGKEQYQKPTSKVSGGHYKVCSVCDKLVWTDKQTYKEYIRAGVNAMTLKVTAEGSVKTETITVKWTKSSSYAITYYKVYRSTSGKDGTFSRIGTTTSKSYVDKTAKVGKTYYYKVIGYREVGNSRYATKTSGAAKAKIKKVTATQVKSTPMYGTTNYLNKALQVMWTSPNIKVDGYEVYRSESGKSGTFKRVKVTKDTTMTWTDKDVKVGKRYYYRVRGYKEVNGKNVYTKFSSKGYRYVLSGTDAKLARAIVRSDAITAKKAVKVSKGIKVTWTKDSDVKTNRYNVYRATSKNGTYKKIATTKNKYYTDKTAKSGKTYYYKVIGYRMFGKAQATTNYSNVVSGKR